jgi:pimeloyl-ACP methyl ester carboxylesterase
MPFADEKGIELLLEHVRSLSSDPTELLAPLLPTLAVPAAVIWGARDPFLKLEYGERPANDIPGAELTVIERASHFSPVDAPVEVADALLRLLARSGSGL